MRDQIQYKRAPGFPILKKRSEVIFVGLRGGAFDEIPHVLSAGNNDVLKTILLKPAKIFVVQNIIARNKIMNVEVILVELQLAKLQYGNSGTARQSVHHP